MPNFEIVGVEAIIMGMAAFDRDAKNVNRLLNQIQKSTESLSVESLTSFGGIERAATAGFAAIVVGAGAAVVAMAGVTAGSIALAAGFEQNIQRAGAVTNATQEQMDALGATVLKVASNTRLSLTDISQLESNLARDGISLADSQNGVLEATVKLVEASGGQLGLAESAKLVSEALKAWHLSAQDVTDVTKSLTAAANDSAISYGDILTIFRQVAPIAAGLGFSVQDVSAAISTMGSAGLAGAVAGTSFKDVLVKLADPTKTTIKEMKEYGVSLEDANHKIVPLREVIERLNKAFGDEAIAAGKMTAGIRQQELSEVFGTRGVEAAIALARGGTDAFDKFRASVDSTDPSKMADAMRDSLIPQLDVTRNIVEGLIVLFGTPLERALTQSIKAVNGFLRAIDPAIPKAFGEALLTIFSGKGAEGVGEQFKAAFGPQLGETLSRILELFLAVRSGITDHVLPAFRLLFSTIFGGARVFDGFDESLKALAENIITDTTNLSRIIGTIAAFISSIRNSEAVTRLLHTALYALGIVAFGLLAAVVEHIAVGLIVMSVQFSALIAIVTVMSDIVTRLGRNWDGTFNGMVRAIEQLPAPLQAVLALVTLLAVRLTIAFVTGTLVQSRIALLTFASAFIPGIDAIVTMTGFLKEVVTELIIFGKTLAITVISGDIAVAMAATAGGVGQLAAEFAVLSAQTIFFALTAVGNAITNLTLLAASFVTARINAAALGTVLYANLGASLAAVVVAIAPVLIALVAIGIGVAILKTVWDRNWLGMRDTVTNAMSGLGELVNKTTLSIERSVLGSIGVFVALDGTIVGVNNRYIGLNSTAQQMPDIMATVKQAVDTVMKAFQGLFGVAIPGLASVDSLIQKNKADMDAFAESARYAASAAAAIAGTNGPANEPPSQRKAESAAAAYDRYLREGGAQDSGAGIGYPTPDTNAPKAKVEDMVVVIERMLKGIQGNTRALAEFLAQLVKVDPSRLQPMVNALLAQKTAITEIAQQYGRVLAVQTAIAGVQEDITRLTAQQDTLALQNEQQILPLKQQLLSLDLQRLQVQQQMRPIEAQIAAIDLQIQEAQRENLAIQGQILAVQQQMLPIQQAMAAIDTQIAILNRTNYDTALLQAQAQLQLLPTQQAITNLEQQATDAVNKRLELLQQEQSLKQNLTVDSTQLQLDQVKQQLDAAFSSGDVSRVKALEQQQYALENLMVGQKDQQTVLNDLNRVQSDTDAITQNGYDQQKQALLDQIAPLEIYLRDLQQQDALQQAITKVAVLGLEQQKAALQLVLDPLQAQLTALQNIKAAQDIATAITVNGLEQQKAALEKLLDPLRLQLLNIDDQTKAIQDNIDIINKRFEIQKTQLDAKLLGDKLELASLTTIKNTEEDRLTQLIVGFANALTASGAFTLGEALETAKRLGYYTSETDNFAKLIDSFGNAAKAVDAITTEIGKIPRDITVTVHVNTVGGIPSFASGGTVPGPLGKAQLVIAHGGERFLGVGSTNSPSFAQQPGIGNRGQVINNYNTSYEVNPTYNQPQDAGSIAMDMRALVAMTRH